MRRKTMVNVLGSAECIEASSEGLTSIIRFDVSIVTLRE